MNRLLLLSVLLCGCASEGLSSVELLGQAPIVNKAPGIRASAVMSEQDALRSLDLARQAFYREDYEKCLAICRQTLEGGAPHSVGVEIRALRFEAKKRLLERQVLVCRVLPDRDLVVVGNDVIFDLTARNVSNHPIRIPYKGPKSTGTVFVIDIEREDWDIFGNVLSEKNRIIVPLTEILDIPVGGRRSVRASLPTGTVADRHLGFTVFTFSGVLRPAVIVCGEERYYQGVTVEKAVVRVVPPGYEPIAEAPIETLSKAWRLGAREHLLLAAELAPPEKRDEVVGILIRR